MGKKRARQRRAANKRKQQNSFNGESSYSQESESISEKDSGHSLSNKGMNGDTQTKCHENFVSKHVPAPVGLINLGNTCFFNSIMQTLIQTPVFHSAIKQEMKLAQEKQPIQVEPEEEDIPSLTYVPASMGQISLALSKFFEAINSLQKSTVQQNGNNRKQVVRQKTYNPNSLFNHICIKNARFRGYQQQDSQELYHCLLDSVKTEEIMRKKRGILQALNLEKAKRQNVSEEICKQVKIYGQYVSHKEDTLIEKVFGGKLISSVLCDGCGTVTGVTEPFHDLSLPIVEERRMTKNNGKVKKVSEENDDETLNANQKNTENTPSKHAMKKARIQARRQNRHRTKHHKSDEEPDSEGRSESEKKEIVDLAASLAAEVICDAMESLTLLDPTSEESVDSSHILDTAKLKGGAVLKNTLNIPSQDESAEQSSQTTPKHLPTNGELPKEAEEDTSEDGMSDIGLTGQLFDAVSEDEVTSNVQTGSRYSSDSSSQKESSLFDTPVRQNIPYTYSDVCCNLPGTLAPRHAPENSECSVTSCLYQFTMPEMLSGTNKFGCEVCTKKEHGDLSEGERKTVYCSASKQMLIISPPTILTVHLKRFQQVGYSLRKVNRHVDIPLQLDIAPFCSVQCKESADENMKVLYNLYGIVEHSGSLSRGHYTAYVKVRPDDATDKTIGEWFFISDTKVTKSSQAKALNSKAYLLFYERVK